MGQNQQLPLQSRGSSKEVSVERKIINTYLHKFNFKNKLFFESLGSQSCIVLVLFIFRADMLQPVYSRGHDMNIPNLEKNFKQVYTQSMYYILG